MFVVVFAIAEDVFPRLVCFSAWAVFVLVGVESSTVFTTVKTLTANTMGTRPPPPPPPPTFWEWLIRTRQVANAFPHLESVVRGSLTCLNVVWVSHSRLFRLLASELGYRKPHATIQSTLNSSVLQRI